MTCEEWFLNTLPPKAIPPYPGRVPSLTPVGTWPATSLWRTCISPPLLFPHPSKARLWSAPSEHLWHLTDTDQRSTLCLTIKDWFCRAIQVYRFKRLVLQGHACLQVWTLQLVLLKHMKHYEWKCKLKNMWSEINDLFPWTLFFGLCILNRPFFLKKKIKLVRSLLNGYTIYFQRPHV